MGIKQIIIIMTAMRIDIIILQSVEHVFGLQPY
jgi:hypothetical protein